MAKKNKEKVAGGGGTSFYNYQQGYTLNIVQCWDPYIVQRNQLADVLYIFTERDSF